MNLAWASSLVIIYLLAPSMRQAVPLRIVSMCSRQNVWCPQGADHFYVNPCTGHGFLYLGINGLCRVGSFLLFHLAPGDVDFLWLGQIHVVYDGQGCRGGGGCLLALFRGAVKCTTLHLWAANLAFTACGIKGVPLKTDRQIIYNKNPPPPPPPPPPPSTHTHHFTASVQIRRGCTFWDLLGGPVSQRHLIATHCCVYRANHSAMAHPSKKDWHVLAVWFHGQYHTLGTAASRFLTGTIL